MSAGSLAQRRNLVLALIVAALVALVGVRAPVFVSGASLMGVLTDTSFLFMLACAQAVVLLTRGIDLSIASNLALSGAIACLAARAAPEAPVLAVVALAMIVGGLLGTVNGLLVAYVEMPPIVVTLGAMAIYRGAIFILLGGAWLTQADMSAAFLAFPKIPLLGVPMLLWIALLVTACLGVVVGFTSVGRSLYAVGGNPIAALYCGVDAPRLRCFVYILSGTISGLCGYLWVARFGIAYGGIAEGLELNVIAACAIGGVSMAGGVGGLGGACLGALLLGVIANALPVIGVSPFWQTAISGVAILAAVVLNARTERRPGKIILPEAKLAPRAQAQ